MIPGAPPQTLFASPERARNVHVLFSVRNLFLFMHRSAVASLWKIPLVLALEDKPKQPQPSPDQRPETPDHHVPQESRNRPLFHGQARRLRNKSEPRPAQRKGNTYSKLISGG